MNKNWRTRPTANDLLALPIIQQWARENNIISSQLSRPKNMANSEDNLEAFKKATRDSLHMRKSESKNNLNKTEDNRE